MIIKLLTKLVNIDSVSKNEKNLTNFLYRYISNFGYKVKKQFVEKARCNLLIEKGQGKESILLYSHLDTVDVTAGWHTNPFQLTIKSDRGYGLGAWDMKGGMAINIKTFLDYQPKNFKLKLALCVDEENISKGGYKLLESSFIDHVKCVISTEPAFCHGLQGIVTGRIGRAVYEINIIGQSKHFAFYEKQFDTNLLAAEFLKEVSKLNKEISEEKKQFVFARKIGSSAIGLSIPEQTRIELDSSVPPPLTSKKILSKIKQIVHAFETKYNHNFKIAVNFLKRATPFLEPYEINNKNKYLKKLANSIKFITGKSAKPYFRSSVADENIFGAKKITTLGIGPIGGNTHAPNEWVSISSMEKLQKILMDFLTQIDINQML